MKPARIVVPLMYVLLILISQPALATHKFKDPKVRQAYRKLEESHDRQAATPKKPGFIRRVTHLVPGLAPTPAKRSWEMSSLERFNANTRKFFVESTRKTREALTTSTEHTKQFFSKATDVLVPWKPSPKPRRSRSIPVWMSQKPPGS